MRLHNKEDYQRLLLELLAPLENKFSDGCARVVLPGAVVSVGAGEKCDRPEL